MKDDVEEKIRIFKSSEFEKIVGETKGLWPNSLVLCFDPDFDEAYVADVCLNSGQRIQFSSVYVYEGPYWISVCEVNAKAGESIEIKVCEIETIKVTSLD